MLLGKIWDTKWKASLKLLWSCDFCKFWIKARVIWNHLWITPGEIIHLFRQWKGRQSKGGWRYHLVYTYLSILQLSLKLGKGENVPACRSGSNFFPPRLSQQGTDMAIRDKVLSSQGVVLFALFIMEHVLGFLLMSEISYIPREVSFIMPILQVVKEGICIDFRHILQITNKVVLSIGSMNLMITHALHLAAQTLCLVMEGIVP